jgi:penicillin-binding protein-related factor A (putative recombinase)
VSGHRGDDWEAVLDARHDHYGRLGLAVAVRAYAPHKQIRRLKGAQAVVVFTGKGPVDYVIATRSVTFHLDAKDCAALAWPLAKLEDHQARHLDAVTSLRSDHVGGILLRLGIEASPRQWFVPWRPGLRERWHAWNDAPGRAKPGTASIALPWLAANAIPMRDGTDWLSGVRTFFGAA